MPAANGFRGVANCYAFKSRLQEYAQKVNFPTPVYETVKKGPSHEPVFKSTVIVNGVRYDSLPGFYNRKAAEQSAAEIALIEIQKSGHMTGSIRTVHETGLCKNLLQEYAQKMNYAIPSYACNRLQSDKTSFTCTVEIGGIRYIGASAKTKKEAEIRVARTALLAIQSSSCDDETNGISQFTVLPGKKKGKEMEVQTENMTHIKPNKAEFKRKSRKKIRRNKSDRSKLNKNSDKHSQITDHEESRVSPTQYGSENIVDDSENLHKGLSTFTPKSNGDFQHALPIHTNDDGIHLGSSVTYYAKIGSCQKSRHWKEMGISLPSANMSENYEYADLLKNDVEHFVISVKETKGTPQGEDHNSAVIGTLAEAP